MNYRTSIFILPILILILIGNSCRSSKTNTNEIPMELEIRLAEGGAASGMWNGYTIKSNGEVLKWHNKQPDETTEVLALINLEKLKEIWSEIIKSEILKNSFQNPGNYSYSIKIAYENNVYYAIWDKNSTNTEVTKLQSIYDKIMSCINK